MSSALPSTSSSSNLTAYTAIFYTAIGAGGLAAFVSTIAKQKFSCVLGLGMCALGFIGVHVVKKVEANELPQIQTAEAFVETKQTFDPLRLVIAGLARKASLTTEAQELDNSLGSHENMHANSTTLLGILNQVSDFLAALSNKLPSDSTDNLGELVEEEPEEDEDQTEVEGSTVKVMWKDPKHEKTEKDF